MKARQVYMIGFRTLAFCLVICVTPLGAVHAQTSFDASGVNGGSIIPGADSRACVPALAGAIRFHSTTSCVEYCDGVNTWVCPNGCGNGGLNYAGNCWYTGAENQSCTQVCAARGGYDSATLSYAGSGGAGANCEALMVAFSGASTASYGGDLNCGATGGGCVYRESDMNVYRCNVPATTEGAAASGFRRFCACNQ